MTDLDIYQQQLADSLEYVIFDEEDVYPAIVLALLEGSAQVGRIPMHLVETLFGLHTVLVINDTGAALIVHPSNYPVDSEVLGHYPDFSVILKTKDGETIRSHSEWCESPSDSSFQVIPLTDSSQLIGAQLELVS